MFSWSSCYLFTLLFSWLNSFFTPFMKQKFPFWLRFSARPLCMEDCTLSRSLPYSCTITWLSIRRRRSQTNKTQKRSKNTTRLTKGRGCWNNIKARDNLRTRKKMWMTRILSMCETSLERAWATLTTKTRGKLSYSMNLMLQRLPSHHLRTWNRIISLHLRRR